MKLNGFTATLPFPDRQGGDERSHRPEVRGWLLDSMKRCRLRGSRTPSLTASGGSYGAFALSVVGSREEAHVNEAVKGGSGGPGALRAQ